MELYECNPAVPTYAIHSGSVVTDVEKLYTIRCEFLKACENYVKL